MLQQGVDIALDIRTGRQAEEGAVGAQAAFTSLRSFGGGTTDSAYTEGARADRQSISGDLENDQWYETDSTWLYRWTGTAWAWRAGLYVATNATRTGLTISADDNGAYFLASDTGILWRVEAAAWVNKFTRLEVTTDLKVNGNKVIGARGSAVADVASPDATDLATAITLVNEIKAQLNTAFARLRSTTGHGLWT